MSANDQQTEQQPTDDPQDAAQAPQDAQETTDAQDTAQESKLAAEGHKYREKIREARAENEELQQRLAASEERRDAVLRDSISRQLPAHITADLFWELTPDLDPLLTEDGLPDDDAVQAAAQALAEQYKITPPRPVIPSQGKSPEKYGGGTTLADAFRPRHG
ncbi:hypothetical protein M3E18_03295 [Kocuria sp. p3-SID1433]|uniref:hypothetical protein n=1 Tax=unclassified Kocuria TaxID=2649579 RepID=UPI0021A9683F|nr:MULTISPECIES: hypothetical protein [unclassified Kocuria]MCT1601889.1 hypothetical protein [Kocuria sp. p3-SID1428]MCT2179572.1 hypothetical protein [Kocuria sp. p3-SID1433]